MSRPDDTRQSQIDAQRSQFSEAAAPIGSSLWVAPNPYGEEAAFLLLHPEADEGAAAPTRERLALLAQRLGLRDVAASGEIPILAGDGIRVALRGAVATLWLGERQWLTFQVPDVWTSAALARKYVVLVIGENAAPAELDAEQVSTYIRQAAGLHLGLVRTLVRVEGT